MIPILNASKATKDTTEFRDWKAFMYHECWRRLLLSIETVRDAEGIYLDVCGQRRLFIPEIAFVSQDSQEVRFGLHYIISYYYLFYHVPNIYSKYCAKYPFIFVCISEYLYKY